MGDCAANCPRGVRGRYLVYARGVEGDRHYGPAVEVILDGYDASRVFKVLLNEREASARSADVSFLVAVGRRDAELERELFVFDSRSLVGEANRVAAVENRYDRLHEVGVNEVFHDLADNHYRDGSALFLHVLIDRIGDFLEIGARCLRGDDDHAGCREHIVVDGDARGVAHARSLLLLGSMRLSRFAGEMGVIGRRIPGVNEGVEIV